jgi:hypothetical protein
LFLPCFFTFFLYILTMNYKEIIFSKSIITFINCFEFLLFIYYLSFIIFIRCLNDSSTRIVLFCSFMSSQRHIHDEICVSVPFLCIFAKQIECIYLVYALLFYFKLSSYKPLHTHMINLFRTYKNNI